jgi:hypothetical protein
MCGREQGSVEPTAGRRVTISREGVSGNTFGVIKNTPRVFKISFGVFEITFGVINLTGINNDFIPRLGIVSSQGGNKWFPVREQLAQIR